MTPTHRRVIAVLCTGAACALAACSDVTPAGPGGGSDAAPAFAAAIADGPEQVMPGEVLAQAAAGADLVAVARAHGLAVGRQGYAGYFAVLKVAPGQERVAAAALGRDRRVRFAEPNYLRQPSAVDARLWAFYNPGGLSMTITRGRNAGDALPDTMASLADADVDNIEGYAANGDDVVIGSLDTGVDLLHPEFTGRLIVGHDWADNDDDPSDTDGHGTHTAGIMAGSTVGVAGVAGAAPHVKVYVQRVCGRRGCPSDAIANAIYAAADEPNLVALNLSLGGKSESQAETDAIAYATSHDVLVVAAAGNAGPGPKGRDVVACPACDDNAISVAATDWRDHLTSYSQYGPGLDLTAPGGNCYSNTTPEGCIYSAYKDGGYAWLQGTSMAAPQVTGAAAVVASVTGLRGLALRNRLLSTADDLGDPGYDIQYGNGRLNIYRAVTGGTLASPQ